MGSGFSGVSAAGAEPAKSASARARPDRRIIIRVPSLMRSPTEPSRREFLSRLAAAGVAAGLAPRAAATGTPTSDDAAFFARCATAS